MAASESRVLTILLTDIRNFTDRTSRSSREGVADLIEKNKQLVLPALQNRGGRLIKTIGDAFLVVFNSPTDAVLAGLDAQRSLAAYNEGKADAERIEVRIAINVGEVTLIDNDVYGEPVNVTSRIEGVAEAGEVFFTEAVYLAMNKSEVPSSEVGWLQLKGVPEKVRVYKVRRETPVGGKAELEGRPRLLEEKGAKAWSVPADPPRREKKPKTLIGQLIPVIVLVGVFGPNLIRAIKGTPEKPRAVADEAVPGGPEKPPRPASGWAPSAADAGLLHGVETVCAEERKRLCADAKLAGGRGLSCLWERWDDLSVACRGAAAPLFLKASGN
jgi:class 3 adenylate cyclase